MLLHKLSISSKWIKKFCDIRSFLFQRYEYQMHLTAEKGYHLFWRQLGRNLSIRKWKLFYGIQARMNWSHWKCVTWKFADYCENWFLQVSNFAWCELLQKYMLIIFAKYSLGNTHYSITYGGMSVILLNMISSLSTSQRFRPQIHLTTLRAYLKEFKTPLSFWL